MENFTSEFNIDNKPKKLINMDELTSLAPNIREGRNLAAGIYFIVKLEPARIGLQYIKDALVDGTITEKQVDDAIAILKQKGYMLENEDGTYEMLIDIKRSHKPVENNNLDLRDKPKKLINMDELTSLAPNIREGRNLAAGIYFIVKLEPARIGLQYIKDALVDGTITEKQVDDAIAILKQKGYMLENEDGTYEMLIDIKRSSTQNQ